MGEFFLVGAVYCLAAEGQQVKRHGPLPRSISIVTK